MRLHRFYVKQPLGEELVVDQSEEHFKELLHQWSLVFRFKPGSELFLFCSDGYDYRYRFEEISKRSCLLTFLDKVKNHTQSNEVVLFMALVKKDTFETVVRHATELGVTKIVPVLSARSEKKSLNFERLEKIAVEATEQSGRGQVPTILPIATYAEALLSATEYRNVFFSLFGEKSFKKNEKPTAVWIGPEGGWTEEEELLAKNAHFEALKLTETVLKADTASVAGLACVLLG